MYVFRADLYRVVYRATNCSVNSASRVSYYVTSMCTLSLFVRSDDKQTPPTFGEQPSEKKMKKALNNLKVA